MKPGMLQISAAMPRVFCVVTGPFGLLATIEAELLDGLGWFSSDWITRVFVLPLAWTTHSPSQDPEACKNR